MRWRDVNLRRVAAQAQDSRQWSARLKLDGHLAARCETQLRRGVEGERYRAAGPHQRPRAASRLGRPPAPAALRVEPDSHRGPASTAVKAADQQITGQQRGPQLGGHPLSESELRAVQLPCGLQRRGVGQVATGGRKCRGGSRTITKQPPCSSARSRPKTGSPSKRGRHSQSSEPDGETSAAVRVSPIKPYSPIGTGKLFIRIVWGPGLPLVPRPPAVRRAGSRKAAAGAEGWRRVRASTRRPG